MSQKNFLHSFLIFDSIPPRKEGSDPIIYYYYSSDQETLNDKNYQLTQAGLIITFISFCQRFNTSLPCDYVFTKVHELSMLELSGSIWMAVVLDSKKPENRALLNSILLHFRMMFSTFFVPLKPLGKSTTIGNQKVLDAIPAAFPSILNSVDWNRLDFRYLFSSYIYQPMNSSINIVSVCKQFLLNNADLFDNIAILYRQNRIIYSSFQPNITRTLAFSMRHRFNHLFLHNPQRESDQLTWLIGLYINKAGLNAIYQQPIYFQGKPHLLVAFRDGYFKIVLSQPPEIEVTEEMLMSIPKRLRMVRQFLDKKNLHFTQNNVPLPYASARIFYRSQIMNYDCFNFDVASGSRMDINFVKSHEYAVMYGRTAVIAAPIQNQCFVRCETKIVNGAMQETLLYAQPTPGGISHNLKISSFILGSKETAHKQTGCEIA
ncbi:hypothetical protein TRFO_12770 [Tritrichomonas foetus]|uniref:CCZ1/INTU/HSP4 first Longin domain-containing protein n=1 Tax=Tritrichomonas foetus TaxID=1144522 RepID=A0A1J4L4Y7_9EUKA|nr:hypothetical protein TRFO_12770 [Tritrichomonas foetus]|eukprot:OHT17052.1 hypothetical protein TRFO_12770 [Tritrichomonas foetus]